MTLETLRKNIRYLAIPYRILLARAEKSGLRVVGTGNERTVLDQNNHHIYLCFEDETLEALLYSERSFGPRGTADDDLRPLI